ncbi:MAG: class II aldolase/adducin family protein [Candidatus Eisenbacteria bacterium]|nr:class II aldolase/adducin family protein [Candidatus Eisenbacteria bacterium]
MKSFHSGHPAGDRPAEGVIQFEAVHRPAELPEHTYGPTVRELAAWREVMNRLGLLGQHPERYEGYGYGNVSARLGPFGNMTQGLRRFLITGTQTGGLRMVGLENFCVVERYDLGANRVHSFGPAQPSSESLTHGALYDAAPDARVVLHGHSPEIWRHARELHLPITRADVANGTPEMAREVTKLVRESAASEMRILVMGGHEDGVLTFGRTAAEAGEALVRNLARACTLLS